MLPGLAPGHFANEATELLANPEFDDPAVPPIQGHEYLTLLTPPHGPDELGRLGPYRVLKVLGVGGMGVVFQGEDPTLGRKVALKAMLPSVAVREANRLRFLLEARATAALRHPHIVTVYTVSDIGGVPFMVIEFLEGESLERRARREGRLPVTEVMRIGRQVAEGLAAAHEKSLIHRDIKPGNIWLEKPAGLAKILDFGLARVLNDDIHLTRPGVIMGTPAYMAPEQANGQPVDVRADLFSLGAVLYRLAAGELPFKGVDTLTMLTALATAVPKPVHTLNPGLPPQLANLIMGMLAKAPGCRPASARAVSEAIATIERQEAEGDVLNLLGTPDLQEEKPASGHALPTRIPEGGSGVHPVFTGDPAKPPLLPAAQLSDLAGHALGHYLLRTVLARGHHAIVFRARHRDRNEVVAVKVLLPAFPRTGTEVDHFNKAMKAGLALQHPHLVNILAAGKTGPYCWIASELIDGESLASVLARVGERRPLEWKQAFRVATHIGRALQAARENRIIHGSITPRNILIRGSDQVAKLNDLLLPRALRNSTLWGDTLDQRIAADACFLAPEQVDSEATVVEYLCDLHCLGVILYRMVTGRLPFRGDTTEQVFDEVMHMVPDRPRKYQKAMPHEFEAVILQMLPKRQEDRYPGPTALLEDLNRIARLHRIAD